MVHLLDIPVCITRTATRCRWRLNPVWSECLRLHPPLTLRTTLLLRFPYKSADAWLNVLRIYCYTTDPPLLLPQLLAALSFVDHPFSGTVVAPSVESRKKHGEILGLNTCLQNDSFVHMRSTQYLPQNTGPFDDVYHSIDNWQTAVHPDDLHLTMAVLLLLVCRWDGAQTNLNGTPSVWVEKKLTHTHELCYMLWLRIILLQTKVSPALVHLTHLTQSGLLI